MSLVPEYDDVDVPVYKPTRRSLVPMYDGIGNTEPLVDYEDVADYNNPSQIANKLAGKKDMSLKVKIATAATALMALGMAGFQVYNYLRKAPLVNDVNEIKALGMPTRIHDYDDHSDMFNRPFSYGGKKSKKSKKSVKKTKKSTKSVKKTKKSVKKSKKSVKRK